MYDIQRCIGKGSYGRVYKATKGKKDFAIKRVNVGLYDFRDKVALVDEIRLLKYCNCPYILKLLDCEYSKYNFDIVTSLANKGDLGKLLLKRDRSLEENTIWIYFIQIALAVRYLHRNKIIHRDIKPSNVYICDEDRILLGDFGVAKVLKSCFTSTKVGTPYYMSPELFCSNSYSTEVDIWALGCLLYELITFKPPFDGCNIYDLLNKIRNRVFSTDIKIYDTKYSKQLLAMIPLFFRSKRLTIYDLVKMDSFQTHMYLIPYAEQKEKDITNIENKFASYFYAKNWIDIAKFFSKKPQPPKAPNCYKQRYRLPPIRNNHFYY